MEVPEVVTGLRALGASIESSAPEPASVID